MDKQTVVVVTGAGSGIGQATAIAFSKQGHFVVGLDLSEAGLQKTKSLIAADRFHAVDLDVRDEVQVAEAFKYVRSTGLNLHAVAACAGVAKTSSRPVQQASWPHSALTFFGRCAQLAAA